jgi:hypothetical protein
MERVNYGSDFYEKLAKQQRVGSADYFDRYFFFGVQPDDVSDQLVDSAIAELEASEGPKARELREVFSQHAGVVFEKLVRRRDDLSENQRAGVFLLLADGWEELPDDMFVSAKIRSQLLGAELLAGAPPERIDLERLVSSPSHRVFAGAVFSRLIKPDDQEMSRTALPAWITELVDAYVERAFLTLDEAKSVSLEEQEEWVVPLLFRLRELAGPERVTEWLQMNLGTSAWSVEDLAAALLPMATAYGGGRPTKVLAHADDIGLLKELLPIEWVITHLTGLEEAGEPLDRLTMTEDDLTFEKRIRHVKAVIRDRLEKGELVPYENSPPLNEEE